MNRGKDFEETFKKQMVTGGFDVNRVCDNTAGYMGGRNICDFITYVYPNIFYFELKSTKGNTLPFSNISKNQWVGLLEKEKIEGAGAGIIVWFLEHDKTFFVSASCLQAIKNEGVFKSLHIRDLRLKSEEFQKGRYHKCFEIPGVKKRVFFDYDMQVFKQNLERYMNYGK